MRIIYLMSVLYLFSVSLYAQEKEFTGFTYNNLLIDDLSDKYIKEKKSISFTEFQQIDSPDKKSVGKAMLFSLLIPGAGEYYVGETFYAKLFLGIEILGWSSIFFNRYYYNSMRKDYMAFATLHAGVNKKNKDDQFWIDIGKYDDIYSYNNKRVNQRRINELYDLNGVNYWRWDSFDNRYTYDLKRLKSVSIKNREIFITVGIVVNHLVSAINAVRLARRHNKNLAQNSFNYGFVINIYEPQNQYMGFTLSKSF